MLYLVLCFMNQMKNEEALGLLRLSNKNSDRFYEERIPKAEEILH